MDVAGLPQFTVLEVRAPRADGDTEIVGRLSHLRGVRNDAGLLYRPGGPSIVGDLGAVPRDTAAPVVFTTPDAGLAPELTPGAVYPWLDGYWQAYHLDMILASPDCWQRRVFAASPAQYFRQAGVTGWQPVGGPLPDGAEDLGVRAGAWDHEHCELCEAHIGAGGTSEGYVDPGNRWLCPACFERYAACGDVSFAAEV